MKTRRFSSKRVPEFTITLLLGIVTFLAACSTQTPTPCPKAECPECPQVTCPECPQVVCPECLEIECPEIECPEPTVAEVPYYEETLWAPSAHNQSESEAFRHWDEDDPPEIPASCAGCHSTSGYLDFLGADGTAPGTVENAVEIGTTVTCIACHNQAATLLTSVTFPSGLQVNGLGDEARCMQCHQGRASTTAVDEVIAQAGLSDDDTASEEFDFVHIHHSVAAVTQMGTWAMGGYQYKDKSYDARFAHVEGVNTCTDCHAPHTLELKMETCGQCHQGVDEPEDLDRIRAEGSARDYDGDRNIQEGIYREIRGLQEILYQAIQAYASSIGTPIVYEPHTWPYFFIDTNNNGEVDEGEIDAVNRYNAWTGRLLKAAYNYQVSMQDPGAFIHGGKYVIQLLYDSIEDLDAELVYDLTRDDAGHFAGSEQAWRHWDEAGEIPSSCARCHSATALPTFLAVGSNLSQPVSNGMLCVTCHTDLKRFKRHTAQAVEFPSGVELSIDADNNLCLNCHQGRESSLRVEAMIEGLAPDAVVEDLRLPDSHYSPAGATLFGGEAQGAYQYPGQAYAGRNTHVLEFDDCINCHGGHRLSIDEEQCATCHGARAGEDRTKPQHHPSPMRCRDCHGMVKVEKIRGHKDYLVPVDYDGDGDVIEGLVWEVVSIHDALYAAIQTYANDVAGTPIVYDAHIAPYFFIDTNRNGAPDPGEVNADNRYNTWTPRLVQAAFNYLYATRDPGAYAHNGKYIIQVLYDSLADIGGDTSAMIRP